MQPFRFESFIVVDSKIYLPEGCIPAYKKIVILAVAVFFVVTLSSFAYAIAVGDG